MSRDKVKFAQKGMTVYGLVENYCEEAEAAKAKGNAIVSDAILPARYEVKENLLVDIPSGALVRAPEGDKNHFMVFDDEYHRYGAHEFED